MATSLTNNTLTLNSLNLNAILGGNILVDAGTDYVQTSGTKNFTSGTWLGFFCASSSRSYQWEYNARTGVTFTVKYTTGGSPLNYFGGESLSESVKGSCLRQLRSQRTSRCAV